MTAIFERVVVTTWIAEKQKDNIRRRSLTVSASLNFYVYQYGGLRDKYCLDTIVIELLNTLA